MPKKKVAVKYTSRDFISIKNDLVEYAKRYYPDTFRDFNEASFGSLMLDTVAYVGDMLSFYVDYQANESFLSTAIEYQNVLKLTKQLGFKFKFNPSAFGIASFYVLVPANTVGSGPNTAYLPILEKGSEFSSEAGKGFILNEDVDFGVTTNEIVSARQDPTTGNTTYFAVKAVGQVISGQLVATDITVGKFEKFRRVRLAGQNIAEILEVVDSEGNHYHEVDYLSQDVVYKPLPNPNVTQDGVSSLLRAIPVPRRFVVEQEREQVFLQFGFGSDSQLTNKAVVDPSNVVLDIHGKDYFADKTLDPNNLISTDKLGIAPANTILTITYRANTELDMNVAATGLNTVVDPKFKFNEFRLLSRPTAEAVINSLEISNEEPLVGSISYPTAEELRARAYATFATQNRAVTKQDYISMIYNMPSQFGAVKRCNILQDPDSYKRNLNLYVISEDSNGNLAPTNLTIKQNLKTWLTSVKMINDTLDILDGRIINLGINFVAVGARDANRFDILNHVYDALVDHFEVLPNMSDAFYITDIYNVINDVEGIMDVVSVDIVRMVGAAYSSVSFDIDLYKSPDGRLINFPEDFIWEVKFPKSDIKGTIK